MKRLILLLLVPAALPLQAVPPTVSAISFDGIGHSNFRVTFNVSGAYDHLRTRTIASPGTCTGGTGGRLQEIPYFSGAAPPGFLRTSGMFISVGGLNASTTYNVCPEVSNDGGLNYSTGVSGSVLTLALPSPHPQLPRDVETFDTSAPNTGDVATMSACPTPNGQGYCKETTASNCSDLQSMINDALSNQAARGTIIQIPHGSVCTAAGIGSNQILFPVYSVDLVPFTSADVTVGNPGIITFSGGQPFTENQMVTMGNHGFSAPPNSSSCPHDTSTFAWGSHYYVHIVNSTQINLRCSDETGSQIGTTLMEFTDVGSGAGPIYLAPHILTSGTCQSTSGRVPCTYQSRNLKWIIIRSDATDAQLPPDGSRINPSYFASGLGATLVDPVANVSGAAGFVLFGRADGNEQTMTSHIRWGPGIETTNEIDPSFRTYSHMFFGAEVNSSIVLDRAYLHGGDYPQRWGNVGLPAADLEGSYFAIVNSWIDNLANWHAANGTDGASIILSDGPGPTVLYNNHIEGAGIPIHFDGTGGTRWLNGNYSVIRNTFHTPLKYMHGTAENTADFGSHWSGNRQPFEIKQGYGAKIGGNIFDTQFSDNTAASVFTAFTAVAGLSIYDVNVYSNTYKHGPGVMNVPLLVAGGQQNAPPNRFWAHNNLAFDINVARTYTATGATQGVARGWLFQGPNGGEDVLIENNTISIGNLGTQPVIFALEEIYSEGVFVRNNFFTGLEATNQGVVQDSSVPDVCNGLLGKALMDCKFTGNGGYVFANNVLMSTDGSNQATVTSWFSGLSNYVPASMSLSSTPGWLQYDASGAGGIYGLKSTSTYRSGSTSHGTNGADIGVDLVKLLNDQGHVRFASVTPIGTTTATVNFTAPDNQSCPVRVTATTPWTSSSVPTSGVLEFPDGGTAAGPRSVSLTGLTTGTLYYGIVLCSVEQPTFQLHTR